MSDYELARVKRDWVPDWLWRVFCVGNLATFTPFKELLTTRPTSGFAGISAADADDGPAKPLPIEDAGEEWPPLDFGGPTVGYCSKCGEVRDAFYTCRNGGETVPKDQAPPGPWEASDDS